MGIEAVTYIADLTTTNPVESDPIDQGNEHVALILKALRNSLQCGINSPIGNSTTFAPIPYRYDRDALSLSVTPRYPAAFFRAGPFSFETANLNEITPQLFTLYDGLGCSEAPWASEIVLPEDRAINISWWGSYVSTSSTATTLTLRDQNSNVISTIVTNRDSTVGDGVVAPFRHIFNSVSHRAHTTAMSGLPRVLIPKIFIASTPVITDFVLYINVELAHYDTD